MENRYLKVLETRLMPRLEVETKALKESFPDRNFHFWGNPYGPPDVHQRFGAGIATDTHSLVIDISEVRYLPCVTVTLHASDGGVSGSAIWAKPLGSLRDLPQMLRFFRAAVQGGEAADMPFPFVTLGSNSDDLADGSLSSDLEMEIFRAAVAYLESRHGLTIPAVDLGAEGSVGKERSWLEAAARSLSARLPGLQEQTVQSFYGPRSLVRLIDSPALSVFSPLDSRSELAWAEYFRRYPTAPGRLRFSRPGFNSSEDQALLSARLICEPENIGAVANVPPYGQAGGAFHLLLLLDKQRAWSVSAECDFASVASEVDDQVRFQALQAWFSRPEIAACLGLDSIVVETLSEGRYDLLLRRGRWSRQVAILEQSWVRQQAQDEVYTVDRAVAVVADLDKDAAMGALLQLLEPWDREIRQG